MLVAAVATGVAAMTGCDGGTDMDNDGAGGDEQARAPESSNTVGNPVATAAAQARTDVGLAVAATGHRDGVGMFVTTERQDPCFAESGGLSGQVQAVVETVADLVEPAGLDALRGAGGLVADAAAAWGAAGFRVERDAAADLPAPAVFGEHDDGRKVSLRYAVPKRGRPWRVIIGASSPCVDPDFPSS